MSQGCGSNTNDYTVYISKEGTGIVPHDDNVKHPRHYTWHPAGVECRTVVQEFPYNIGVAIAYLWRHNHKGTPIEDLRKAIQHIEFEIERRQCMKPSGQ